MQAISPSKKGVRRTYIRQAVLSVSSGMGCGARAVHGCLIKGLRNPARAKAELMDNKHSKGSSLARAWSSEKCSAIVTSLWELRDAFA